MTSIDVNIGLHDAQRLILSDEHKYKVVNAGRQFGKSEEAATFGTLKSLVKNNAIGWIISPTYKQSSFLFKKIVRICNTNKIPIKVKKTPQDMSIYFEWTGSTVMALSADNKDNLRGATLDWLVFDEAAMVSDDSVWYEVLMPMCWKDDCQVMFISTPKGKNWFYDLYNMEKKDDRWVSFHYTSDSNPFIPKDFIESMRVRLDADTFRQEILAEFIDGAGIVFTDFDIRDMATIADPLGMYIAGVDLAKEKDFTVVTVLDISNGVPIYCERWQKESWDNTIDRIESVYTTYNKCPMIVDGTGLGDPIVERLLDKGVDAREFVFSSKTKPQLVRNLVAMLQARETYVPNNPTFIDEFERYSYYITIEGNVKYSAPNGYHDDCVISLGLAAWGLKTLPQEVGGIYDTTNERTYEDFITSIDFNYEYDIKESYSESLRNFI